MKTKEERRMQIESARAIARLGGSDVSEHFLFQAERYIDGEISMDEFDNIIHRYWEERAKNAN